MARRAEGGDDRRLQRVGEQRLEAERAHAADEDARVLAIAPAAAGDAAFGEELVQRLMEGDDDVDRRREAVLAGLLEIAALVEQVERQRRGVALGRGERFAPADDEAQARHAFEALVGGGGDGVERRLARVELERAEGAHRVDQQPPAAARAERGDLLDRIEDAAGRLAVDGEDVGDRRRLGEQALDRVEVGRRVLRRFVGERPAAGDGENALGALAVGAVDQHQRGAVARDEGGQHRLDGEGARALHRHGHVLAFAVDDLRQAAPGPRR